jgi:hypothetical protein
MIPSRTFPRSLTIASLVGKGSTSQRRCFREASQLRIGSASRVSPKTRKAAWLLSLTIGAGCLYHLGYPRNLYAEEVPTPAEIKFETRRVKTTSREENRDQISSQHLQVKTSWENPGVYCWGSNSGKKFGCSRIFISF